MRSEDSKQMNRDMVNVAGPMVNSRLNYRTGKQGMVADTRARLDACVIKSGRTKVWVVCQAVNEWLDKHEGEL